MKVNYNSEYVDQYLYDYGLEKTKQDLKLSDKQIESILFKNPIKFIQKKTIDKHYIEDDIIYLYDELSDDRSKEIEEKYNEVLDKLKIKLKREKSKIDGNSYELLDRIHQQFLKMMLNDIEYKSIQSFTTSINNIELNNNRTGYNKNKYILNNDTEQYSINEYENTITDEHINMLINKFNGVVI